MGPSSKELGRELFLDVKDFVREVRPKALGLEAT